MYTFSLFITTTTVLLRLYSQICLIYRGNDAGPCAHACACVTGPAGGCAVVLVLGWPGRCGWLLVGGQRLNGTGCGSWSPGCRELLQRGGGRGGDRVQSGKACQHGRAGAQRRRAGRAAGTNRGRGSSLLVLFSSAGVGFLGGVFWGDWLCSRIVSVVYS